MTAERFTAWAVCPKCERVECHGLRAPRSFDWNDPHDIFLMTATMFSDAPLHAWEEGGFEVVRQCKCGHEWGQV